MKSTSLLLLIFLSLVMLSSFGHCDNSWQIHQLKENSLSIKDHHQLINTNLRKHDRTTASASDGIMGALMGFVLGPVLFLSAFICIWFNEKRAVIDYRRLRLAQEICVQVNPFRRDQITTANMKLSHISGNSTTNSIIGDRLSNVSINGAIKLIRKVQVMEWRASTTQRNGNREVDYHLGWHSQNTPNVEGRSNPQSNWFVQPETIYNQNVTIGEYILSKSQADQCHKSTPINPDINNANTIAANTHRNTKPVIQGGYIYFPSPTSNSISDHGALRIQYSYCPVGPITLMAKTVQNTFQPFPIAEYQGNGQIVKNQLPACCCLSNCIAQLLKPIQEIDLVEEEIMSKSEIIQQAVKKSKVLTWVIRIVTYLMMVLGICMFFSPITTILGFIPLVGGLLKGTVGFAILLAALLVCIPLWIIGFSLAWLWYHPKVGAIFLGVGVAILGLILFVNYARQGNTEAAQQTVKHLLRTWTN